ncbi:uncharacterized protein E6C27_scaffold190G001050 [Cucumis melo var. makuwa]|uniref:Asp_protease_2 domain-containing protein n=1 Tax=Cucumis melo var. makuwa TaxID=1194695 RepID=A0A5A7UJ92_CUCMM|nr:uncharacterized protein E6C27_scaffold190G001050 [Cucumis melo var. makuwa]
MSEDFRATHDVVKNEIADVNTRLNLTMQAMAYQVPVEGAVRVTKATNTVTEEVKVTLATMYLCEDAKLWWRSRYMDIQEGRYTIDIWDVLKKELCSQFFLENVEILARRKLCDLKHTGNIRDSSPGRNMTSCSSSTKDAGGGKDFSRDRKPYQSNTENTWRWSNNRSPPKRSLSCFICEGSHLARECLNKVDFHAFQDSLIPNSDDKSNQAKGEVGHIEEGGKTRIGAIKYLSSLQKKSGERNIPTKRGLLYVDTWINQKQTKSTMVDSSATHNFIRGRGQTSKTPLGEGFRKNEDFVIVKMDDFDVVLGMEILLEHQVIPMPSAKCLVITRSFPTIVQANIHQPNGFKMIPVMQLDRSPAQEEPPSIVILLGALGKLGETVPKDTLCVPEKCHGVMPNSWPKFLSM